jgi:DNA-binding transcriptional LysR family regulator
VLVVCSLELPLGYNVLYRPRRVMLTDAGVVLVATARRVTIGWAELTSVERVGAGRSRRLKWRRARGRAVVTSDEVVDVHRMLTEVEQWAPHVLVSS